MKKKMCNSADTSKILDQGIKKDLRRKGHHEFLAFANAATCLVRFVRSKAEPSLRDR